MPETENEPYTRWQGFRIGQLSLCIALFLSFAVASLGFSLRLLTEPQCVITSCYAKVSFLVSLIAGVLSLSCGSIACLTRLADFRITAQVARHPSNTDNDRLRDKYNLYGRWSWGLFRAQLVLFA
jgi:hypothetical protein